MLQDVYSNYPMTLICGKNYFSLLLIFKPTFSMPFSDIYKGKTVLVTGHTGFKGGWLTLWLKNLGANVIGLSLDPQNEYNFFNSTNLKK